MILKKEKLDFLLQSIIKPALESDFEIQRSDLISSTNKITDEIIGGLTNSELVIVDLSTHNPNVFYELGYRHALERPTITMINKILISLLMLALTVQFTTANYTRM